MGQYNIQPDLEREMDILIAHYPPERRRAAVLWLLHLLQERDGYLTTGHVEWIAAKYLTPLANTLARSRSLFQN